MKKRLAAVYVLTPDGKSSAGYYTLSAYSVRLDKIPEEIARKLTRMPEVQATLVGRLARSSANRSGTSATCGLLDPAHAQTRGIMEQVVAVIERRPSHRTLATDSEIWREAGILSGTLARLQGYKSDQRRRVLNDALLFATARTHGCSVLTRSVFDFDFLQQLDPSGKVLFYR